MKHALIFVATFALAILGGLAIDWGFAQWIGVGLMGAGAITLLSAWRADPSDRATLIALEQGAKRIAEGDLDTKISDSLGRLHPSATAFDRMTQELKRTQSALARSERMAAWRDIARRIAHEIKNPLLPIRVSMETLRKAHDRNVSNFEEILTESTTAVLEETHRLQRIVEEFSDFARMPSLARSVVSVSTMLDHLAALFPEAAVTNEAQQASVQADRDQLTQLLVNLMNNAFEAAGAANSSCATVVRLLATMDGDSVMLVVEDNGPGVSEPDRERIFEPYHTTKASGTGLGLAIAHRIVVEHEGSIDVLASHLGGARFEVRLPLAGSATQQTSTG